MFTWLAFLAIAYAVGLHLYRMAGMPFTNYDDMLMGLTADRMRTEGWWSSYYALARIYALWQGRIYFYFSMFFFVLPYLIRWLFLRALIATLLQTGAACSIAVVLGQYAGFRSALMFVALACAWLPYWPVSPVNGFPFHYQLPVILFFASLALWIRLARGQKTPRFAAAFIWAAFLVSLFFYEALIPPFFVIVLVVATVEARRDRASVVRAWAFWGSGFGLWAAIYLGFRRFNPGTYDGSVLAGLGHGQWRAAATSLFYFESYSLPGADWIGNLHYNALQLSGSLERLGIVPFFLRNLAADGIVLAVLLAAVVVCRGLGAQRKGEPAGAGKAAALALLCAVMMPLPLAFTAKYRIERTVLEVAPYLPGYYSFLAWCVVLALAFPLAASALRRVPAVRWAATLLLAGVCALVSAASTVSDDAVYRRFAESGDKWKLVDLLARTDWFAALPANSVFLAPGLWDGFPHTSWLHGDAYWTAYFSAWAGRPEQVIRLPRQVPELLARHTPVFYCEHQWLPGRRGAVLAIEPVAAISPAGDAVSDSVLLLSQSGPAGMAVEYRASSEEGGGGIMRAQVPAWREEHGAYIARVSAPDLIAGTALVTDADSAPPLDPILQFGRGFSGTTERGADGQYWRWSDGPDGEAEIDLFNPSERPVTVRFRTSLHFNPGASGHAAFDFHRPEETETVSAILGETIEQTWRLAPGPNRIVVKCHAGRIPAPGDPRYLVFGLWNWSVAPADMAVR